ncbi:hypothetical protein NL676_022453 [Syzygium grande]|nr:hypothetical protein NL676_022453 [Syzygium grande]
MALAVEVEARVVVMAEATEVRGLDTDMTMAAATAVTALVEATEDRVEATEARVVVLVEAMVVQVEATEARVVVLEATVVLVEAMVVQVVVDMTMEATGGGGPGGGPGGGHGGTEVVVLVEAMVVRVADMDMTMEEAMAASQEEITATADQVGMALAAMVLEAATTTADASSPPLGSCCGLVSHG